MKPMRKKQNGGVPMWVFGVILIAIVVGGAWYLTDGFTDNPLADVFEVLDEDDTADTGETQVKQDTEEDEEYCNRPGITC